MKWWPFETNEALISSLFHKDWKIREKAKASLDRKDPQWPKSKKATESVPEFIAGLQDTDSYFRETAAEILGLIGDPRAVEPLMAVLKDPIARQAAARALGLIGDKRAVGSLIDAQTNPGKHFRKTAMDALARIDPDWPKSLEAQSQIPELIASLKYGDAVLDALARINPDWKKSGEARKQIPGFISALKDVSGSVRKAGAEVLKYVGDDRATDSLIDVALNDTDVSVRMAARNALERLNPGWTMTAKARGQVSDPNISEGAILRGESLLGRGLDKCRSSRI